jgi:hypothetical protein
VQQGKCELFAGHFFFENEQRVHIIFPFPTDLGSSLSPKFWEPKPDYVSLLHSFVWPPSFDRPGFRQVEAVRTRWIPGAQHFRDVRFAGIENFGRQGFGMQHQTLMKLLRDNLYHLFMLFIAASLQQGAVLIRFKRKSTISPTIVLLGESSDSYSLMAFSAGRQCSWRTRSSRVVHRFRGHPRARDDSPGQLMMDMAAVISK